MKKSHFIFILIITFLSLSFPNTGLACDCGENTYENSFNSSELVAIVTVREVKGFDQFNNAVKVSPSTVLKGTETNLIPFTIYTGQNDAGCGYNFKENEKYLVFARKERLSKNMSKDVYTTTSCIKNVHIEFNK
ncbi:MAG: hypothetical protein EB060_06210 [Proteobacteria bacterium]|nr:hypothetical protein [Pseudomonadota bacterium]